MSLDALSEILLTLMVLPYRNLLRNPIFHSTLCSFCLRGTLAPYWKNKLVTVEFRENYLAKKLKLTLRHHFSQDYSRISPVKLTVVCWWSALQKITSYSSKNRLNIASMLQWLLRWMFLLVCLINTGFNLL